MIECMKRFCGKIYRRKGLVIAYIRAIKDKKEGASISVRRQDGDTDDFPITIGLHQGSTLSPYLFTLVLDVLMEHVQELALRCMLFAVRIVLLGESGGGIKREVGDLKYNTV
jgi:hypothetical protein